MRTNLKNVGLLIAVLAIVGFMWVSTSFAAEEMLTGTVNNTVTAMSKANKQYVRIILDTDKSLNGVKYSTQSVVMAFDEEVVKKAKEYKKGDKFSAVCSSREWNGRTSYQILKLAGMKPVATK